MQENRLKTVPIYNTLQSQHPKMKAVLWDMDGTIMQTEPLHALCTLEILKLDPSFKETYEEVERVCVGETDKKILNHYQQKGFFWDMKLNEFISQKNELIKIKISETPRESIVLPEIIKLIEGLKLSGLKQAIVTSSEKELTEFLLENLDLRKYFDFVITREDTKDNKPSPMPYQYAMNLLKLTPREVLIFEDSKIGLQAAKESKATFFQADWYLEQ